MRRSEFNLRDKPKARRIAASNELNISCEVLITDTFFYHFNYYYALFATRQNKKGRKVVDKALFLQTRGKMRQLRKMNDKKKWNKIWKNKNEIFRTLEFRIHAGVFFPSAYFFYSAVLFGWLLATVWEVSICFLAQPLNAHRNEPKKIYRKIDQQLAGGQHHHHCRHRHRCGVTSERRHSRYTYPTWTIEWAAARQDAINTHLYMLVPIYSFAVLLRYVKVKPKRNLKKRLFDFVLTWYLIQI